jgi:Protein of unknown function (DUF3179)
VWEEQLQGRRLRFHLCGINNQNFVMCDEETGSWWQQASGEAFAGPLRGGRLRLVRADELAFGIWRREHPDGRVLRPGATTAWRAFSADWEAKTGRLPVVAGVPGADGRGPLPPRTLVLGLEYGGAARAYPVDALGRQGAVADDLGGLGVVILVAEDGRSLRAFESTIDGRRVPFFVKVGPSAGPSGPPGSPPAPRRWLDGTSGSEWDFQGRAVAGPWRGRQLVPLPAMKDYWFDWRIYHPRTTVYLAAGEAAVGPAPHAGPSLPVALWARKPKSDVGSLGTPRPVGGRRG